MSQKILFVDDDRNLLSATERNLRKRFQVETAEGGQAGLKKVAETGPYAVVVVDMQMPGMNGIEVLSAIKELSPTTVRIMLTGNADMDVAIKVVNEGNIFRFLTKPCDLEVLTKALTDALAQYQLINSEKELLNSTLSGSIKLLTDILSLMDNQSFGRAQRLRDLVTKMTDQLKLADAWEIHLAIMLSRIGDVTLPPELLLKARSGTALTEVESQMLAKTPETAARLLSNIPRLEGVSNIVRYQYKNFDGTGFPLEAVNGEAIPQGARWLRILRDMLELESKGLTQLTALDKMRAQDGAYDPVLLSAVRGALITNPGTAGPTIRASVQVGVKGLERGMILRSNIETTDGVLILTAGHRINDVALEKIENFAYLSGIREPILVENTAG